MNNALSNVSDIEKTLCNPYYLSLIIYIVILVITIYSFGCSNINMTAHIKFFIYSYLFLVIYNFYITDLLIRKTKQDFRFIPSNDAFNDMMN